MLFNVNTQICQLISNVTCPNITKFIFFAVTHSFNYKLDLNYSLSFQTSDSCKVLAFASWYNEMPMITHDPMG